MQGGRKPTRLRWPCLFLLTILPFFPNRLPAETPPPLKNPGLIETVQLSKILGHPSVRIVDLRGSLPDYLKGHIPNAVYLHFESLRLPVNGIPVQSPDRTCLERLLGVNLSVTNAMWVILYSEKSNPNATFLAWKLDLLGHRRFAVLNGGWEKWVAEGLPTVQAYPTLVPRRFFGKTIQEVVAEKQWVNAHLSSKGVVIVDTRAPGQYSGEEGEDIRRGHIPGARNIFWETTLDGDDVKTWKRKDELERLFSDSGITREKEIVVHCRTGREASHLYFTLKHILGFPHVRLYGGSWVEWAADPKLPIKTGIDP